MAHTCLSDAEKRAVADRAAQLNLPVSAFFRCLVLGAPLPAPSVFAVHDAMRDLPAVNADLARPGNLLKLELDAVGGAVPRAFIIAKKVAKPPEVRDSFRALAAWVAGARDPGEKLVDLWIVGCDAGSDAASLDAAIAEVEATRARKPAGANLTYHPIVSLRAGATGRGL